MRLAWLIALVSLGAAFACVDGTDFNTCDPCQPPIDAGVDAGGLDAGLDGGMDAGEVDSGVDAGTDAGESDGGVTVDEWNLEWFGDSSQDPSDDNLQAQNVATVISGEGADLFAVEEVVDYARFHAMVDAMPGYASVLAKDRTVSNYWDYSGSQQVGLIYRLGAFSLDSAQIILGGSSDDFAGRPPLEVSLTLHVNGAEVPLYVIILHMKAYADETSWGQRVAASADLKTYLDTTRAGDRVMVVGDWNDDLDESIACGTGTCEASPYANFEGEPASYQFATQLFTDSNPEWGTTVAFATPIDHHLITNELFGNVIAGSPRVIKPAISGYGTTTSDHYPTSVRYRFP